VTSTSAVGTRVGGLTCRLVKSPGDLAEHHRIRHAVFVEEQAIFDTSDLDVRDGDPATLFVLGLVDGLPAGAVRLYALAERGLWQGDRLAVLPEYRASGLGGPLVRFAVHTAAGRGGTRMIAHVQVANERFFLRLGWTRRSGPEDYVGRLHLLMDIPLDPGRSTGAGWLAAKPAR